MNYNSEPRAITLSSNASAKVRVTEYLDFLAAWVRKPRQTASVVPSSRHLARMMVRDIDPGRGRVIELGGGTGAFTREILATGLPPENLEVVEINPDFARRLEFRFPGVSVLRHRAESISAHVAGEPGSYQQVISGLPLLAMNQAAQRAILNEAFRLLAPGGTFVQFTYSLRSPVNPSILDEMGLMATRVGQIVRNFPPATIFHFQRTEAAEAEAEWTEQEHA